jgi:hypothetical protein
LQKCLKQDFDLDLITHHNWVTKPNWETLKNKLLWQYKTGQDANQFEKAAFQVNYYLLNCL